MSSKDKLIGTALILLGIGFIALGVVFGGKMQATGTQNQVYQEEQIQENEDITGEESVEVYSEQEEYVEGESEEEQVEEQTEEEGTNRYIY